MKKRLQNTYRTKRPGYILATCFASLLVVAVMSSCVLLNLESYHRILEKRNEMAAERITARQIAEYFLAETEGFTVNGEYEYESLTYTVAGNTITVYSGTHQLLTETKE